MVKKTKKFLKWKEKKKTRKHFWGFLFPKNESCSCIRFFPQKLYMFWGDCRLTTKSPLAVDRRSWQICAKVPWCSREYSRVFTWLMSGNPCFRLIHMKRLGRCIKSGRLPPRTLEFHWRRFCEEKWELLLVNWCFSVASCSELRSDFADVALLTLVSLTYPLCSAELVSFCFPGGGDLSLDCFWKPTSGSWVLREGRKSFTSSMPSLPSTSSFPNLANCSLKSTLLGALERKLFFKGVTSWLLCDLVPRNSRLSASSKETEALFPKVVSAFSESFTAPSAVPVEKGDWCCWPEKHLEVLFPVDAQVAFSKVLPIFLCVVSNLNQHQLRKLDITFTMGRKIGKEVVALE